MDIDVNMIEVPGTVASPLKKSRAAMAPLQLSIAPTPVFQAEAGKEHLRFTELVAVTYRDQAGVPVNGGLFTVAEDTVLSLALISPDGSIDTSKEPQHVAFGLCMLEGPVVFRQGSEDVMMELSFIDLNEGVADGPIANPTPTRKRIQQQFLERCIA